MKTISLTLAVGVLFASCSSTTLIESWLKYGFESTCKYRCSSTTLIESYPSGAKVYMNSEYKGVTPYSYSDQKIVGSVTDLRLELDGYETLNASIYRNERADVGAIVGGVFFLFPFLWTMKYNPIHKYELRPASNVSLGADDVNNEISSDVKVEYTQHVLRN